LLLGGPLRLLASCSMKADESDIALFILWLLQAAGTDVL